jgi:hypothetical protein
MLYLRASWRTGGVIVDDDQRRAVTLERLLKDLAHADQG